MEGCASNTSKDPGYQSPCQKMEHEIKVKEKVDAEVKTLKDEVRDAQHSGDTTSLNSASQQLGILLDTQKFLKEDLDQNSQECQPSFYQNHFSL